MRTRILLFFIVIFPLTLKSQTIIPINGIVSGEWNKGGSPYVIEGKAFVPEGKILVIKPGTEIQLNALDKLDYKRNSKNNRGFIHIEGTLKAIGTESDPIVFKSNSSNEKWGSIYLKKSSNSIIEFCHFSKSGGLTDVGGANEDAFGAISIQNCSPAISNVKIRECFNGIYISEAASPEISNSDIMKCDKAAILAAEKSTPIIRNCLLRKSLNGLRCESSDPIVINSNILYNKNLAVYFKQHSSPQISNSIIWGNGHGFEVYMNVTINQCIIQDRIAKIITGKSKQKIVQSNIIGVPTSISNFTSLIVENNYLNVKINGGLIGISTVETKLTEKPELTQTEISKRSDDISDVDINIPNNKLDFKYRYALIIGNEDYTRFQPGLNSEVNVEYAVNDAKVFSEYCNKVLGIPQENIVLLKDAISTQIKREVEKLNKLIQYSQGKAEVIFYYAGHGMPHEVTKEPYIVPVDIAGDNLEDGIKLTWLYSKLAEHQSKYVISFIDACFSGGARNQGLVAARGVKIKPKDNLVSGNCVVLSSSSDIQSSLSYKEKQHGMFTYYLLKKLKETSGNVTLKGLSDYLYENVALNSLKLNNKEQTPSILVSQDFKKIWEDINLLNEN